ncbi:hydrophobic surface binding protein A-domain-containing protein [Morchella snyderi]|nr:hydrophobic surface binding protein A-domain-containing protein [Morchella snyderi]
MRFFKLSVIAVNVYAATFGSAQTSTFEEDFNAISADLSGLKAAIDAFTGAQAEALAVSAAASSLQTDYEIALADTNAATDLESQSATIASAVQALVPPHVEGLDALIAKEPLFEAGGYNSLVLAQLQGLSSASSQLLAALEAGISADISSPASAIAGAYTAAIATFS